MNKKSDTITVEIGNTPGEFWELTMQLRIRREKIYHPGGYPTLEYREILEQKELKHKTTETRWVAVQVVEDE